MGDMLCIQIFFLDDSGNLECIHIHFEAIFVYDWQKLTSNLLASN